MFDRKVDADNHEEGYLDLAIETIQSQPHQPDNPVSLRVLKALMQKYRDDAKSKLGGYLPTTWRNNTNTAIKCLTSMAISKPNEAVAAAIDRINDMDYINPKGDTARLLSVYFSIFQTDIPSLSPSIQEKIQMLDIWSKHLANYADKFTKDLRSNNIRNYEQLDTISRIIPDDKVDQFADFLLKEFTNSRFEQQAGLHHGWVCIALGNLIDRVSTYKRDTIIDKLTDIAKNPSGNLSIIGACRALAEAQNYLTQTQKKEVANRIYQYAIDELRDKINLYADKQPKCVKEYMHMIFETMHMMQDCISAKARETIVNEMIRGDQSYLLRNGLNSLESWLTAEQKLALLENIANGNAHKNEELELLPLLWHWLGEDKNDGTAWSKKRHFGGIFNESKGLLALDRYQQDQYCADDALELHAKILMLESKQTSRTEKYKIIDNLFDEITTNRHSSDATRIKAYRALGIVYDWIPKKNLKAYADAMYESAINEKGANIKIEAASCALKFREKNLLQSQVYDMRDIMLNGLDNESPSIQQLALKHLQAYANEAPLVELPSLMTCLMAKSDNAGAQILLGKVFDDYYSETQEPELADRPRNVA